MLLPMIGVIGGCGPSWIENVVLSSCSSDFFAVNLLCLPLSRIGPASALLSFSRKTLVDFSSGCSGNLQTSGKLSVSESFCPSSPGGNLKVFTESKLSLTVFWTLAPTVLER